MVEFRQLEYFYTISKLENFTRTAETLHVSQPSVTKAIKALEAELGIVLIDRSQKHVSLTEEGRAFLVHVERILHDLDETRRDMQRFRKHIAGTVHFGLPPMVESYVFPNFFLEFRRAYPQVALDIMEYSDSEEVRQRLTNGNLDFGVVLDKPGVPAENELVLLESPMSLCLDPEHHLASKAEVAFAELRQEKFIMQQMNTYQYKSVYALCVESGFTPDILLCTTQLKTIKQLVANKMGISILPDFVTQRDKIFCRRSLVPELRVQVKLAWNQRKKMSPVDKQFISFAQRYTETQEFRREFHQD
jgi:DNA-binding transcriptional LysR family regulator